MLTNLLDTGKGANDGRAALVDRLRLKKGQEMWYKGGKVEKKPAVRPPAGRLSSTRWKNHAAQNLLTR